MTDQSIGVIDAVAALVSDKHYVGDARSLIQSAERHCLCMIFIVDTDPAEDDELAVDGLLSELAAAHWRGVDARLVIGGSRDNFEIRDACLASRERAKMLGVPTRLVAATDQRSVHSKFIVSDDHCLLGSHNWSPGAFGGQLQDSVMVKSKELSAYLLSRFEGHWADGSEEGFDVLD